MFGNLRWRFVTIVVLWPLWVTCAQMNSHNSMNFCISRQTCQECIQVHDCAWCMKHNFSEHRCFFYGRDSKTSKFCPEEYVFYPLNDLSIIQSRTLTSEKQYSKTSVTKTKTYTSHVDATCCDADEHHTVQIAPQEVNIKLRIHQSQEVRFAFSQDEDYPLDLYYLMDLSKSMDDDKKTLSDLGDKLVREISNISSNFRLGFGSFVDKVKLPFSNFSEKHSEIRPCEYCAIPYGYRHIMSLSHDKTRFSELVRNTHISGNLDSPEGGFDAIMQAIVCKEQIGWRDRARKLILFSTDASFHFAGDGKLVGSLQPNDGLCHLDFDNGIYTYKSSQDYPSISQINQKVKQNSINIIWAVNEELMKTYSYLRPHVEGSYVTELFNDSSNIIQLIKDQYNRIRSNVKIRDTLVSDALRIKYWSQCLDKNGDLIETTKCDKLQKGDKVEFIAEITAIHCPTNRSEWNQNFMIYPVGISESLRINLEMICDCDCEHPKHFTYEINSPKCSYNGTYKCGICECNSFSFGKNCECNVKTKDSYDYNAQICRPDNTSLIDCSGRGDCSCGICDCNRPKDEYMKIWGDFCECDNFSCDRRDNKFCSGNGECDCNGICKCHLGWTGKACECKSSTDTCKRPGSKLVCSGRGDCECGQCVCSLENEVRYSGRYCEKCTTCKNKCEELKPCVTCQVYKTGNLTEEKCAANCTEIIERVEKIDKTLVVNDETVCSFIGDDDCTYIYMYFYNETKLVIQAQETPDECPPKIYLLGVILAVVAGIVITGVAMLAAWKTFATIKDKQEFARFEKEKMLAKWDAGENPIYKQATSTFKNPTYSGR